MSYVQYVLQPINTTAKSNSIGGDDKNAKKEGRESLSRSGTTRVLEVDANTNSVPHSQSYHTLS